MELEHFKVLTEMELDIPCSEIGLLFNGVPMTDAGKSLREYGVKDGDMIMMDRIRRQTAPVLDIAATDGYQESTNSQGYHPAQHQSKGPNAKSKR